MLYVLMWVVIGLLFMFWTAMAWGLHLAAQWFSGLDPAQLESATTAAGDAARQAIPMFNLPEGLTSALPAGVFDAWQALAQSLLPWLHSLLLQVPALVSWLSPAIWNGWGLGAVLPAFGGIALHAVIRLFAGRLNSRDARPALKP